MPGAFVGMCNLIQNVDTYVAMQSLKISEEEMFKAVAALRYILSRDGLSHQSVEEAYVASGFSGLSCQARTWVLKNLGDVMIRMWHQAAVARVNNVKDYRDFPINQAAENLMKSFNRGMD